MTVFISFCFCKTVDRWLAAIAIDGNHDPGSKTGRLNTNEDTRDVDTQKTQPKYQWSFCLTQVVIIQALVGKTNTETH